MSEPLAHYKWTAFALAPALELVFRGLVQGRLIDVFPSQHYKGTWFLSIPALFTTLLYVLGAWFWKTGPGVTTPISTAVSGWGLPLAVAGAGLFGLAASVLRERTESVWTCVISSWLALGGLALIGIYGGS